MLSPNNTSELHASPTSQLLFVSMLILFLITRIHAFSSLVFLQRYLSVILPTLLVGDLASNFPGN